MGNKLLDNLATIFWFLPPYMGILYFYLGGGDLELATTLVYYLIYSTSTTVLAGGYWLLCKRAKGKVAAWLVSIAYAETFFAITLWGIVALLIINTLSPGEWGNHEEKFFSGIANALIGMAVGGTLLAALVLVYGFYRGQLDRPISVLPFGVGWRNELPRPGTLFVEYTGWEDLPMELQEDWRVSHDEEGHIYVLSGDGVRTRVEPNTGWHLHKDRDGNITIWKAG